MPSSSYKMNYKITLSYNGSRYHGWSKQPNLKTIEQTLIDAFKKLFKLDVSLNVSGRTDACVHALNQVCNVSCSGLNITPIKLCQALNSQLPSDIFIKHVELVNADFHARFSCKSKTYLYMINTNVIYDVVNHEQIFQYNKHLSIDKLIAASQLLLGEHDFSSFSTTELINCVRNISDIQITNDDGLVQITITGNGFLRSMVRMIVRSLISYHEDKISLDDIKRYLQFPKKGQTIHKVPACGLYLVSVYYN